MRIWTWIVMHVTRKGWNHGDTLAKAGTCSRFPEWTSIIAHGQYSCLPRLDAHVRVLVRLPAQYSNIFCRVIEAKMWEILVAYMACDRMAWSHWLNFASLFRRPIVTLSGLYRMMHCKVLETGFIFCFLLCSAVNIRVQWEGGLNVRYGRCRHSAEWTE